MEPDLQEEVEAEEEGEQEALDLAQKGNASVQTVGIENHINLVYPVILENARNVGHQ